MRVPASGPQGLKPMALGLPNAALKGRSSTVPHIFFAVGSALSLTMERAKAHSL